MKDLILPGIVALALHAMLLTVKMDLGKAEHLSQPGPICLSLSYKTPEIEESPSRPPPEEPRKMPDPTDPAPAPPPDPKPEVQKKSVVKKPRATVPGEKTVPETRPGKVEPQAVRAAPPQLETGADIPSLTPSSKQLPPAANDSQTLASIAKPDEKKAYSKAAVPLYLKNPPPEYPHMARRRGYEGTAVLEVLVDCEGRVRELSLFQSSGHEVLDRAAMQAVKGWLFEPAREGEEKVDMRVKVPLSFRLKAGR